MARISLARRWLCLGAACGLAACTLAAAPAAAQTTLTPRQLVQHTLRRFTFSDSPENVTAVVNEGLSAWLAQQLDWQAIDDSNSTLEQLPTSLNSSGGYVDSNVFERILYQHNLLTQRQLQAKLEQHWLDHFSVSLGGVPDPAIMSHYEMTVRANALGNFATLLTAVAQEPAMLYWLSNNGNYGAEPNENFGREVMQLYSLGTQQLTASGAAILGKNGLPLPTYSQKEVVAMARAMTGYNTVWDYSDTNPETRFSVQFVPGYHYTGPIELFGRTRNVPDDATAMGFVMNILAHQPSTAPFQVTELLKRFVTEKPSAQFIADIVKVWTANVDKPDQIAQVVAAIINHPDFAAAYHGMLKQPTEKVFGVLRQLPGMMQASSTAAPGGSLLNDLSQLGQQMFYPPNVFSFYYPGHLETLTNTQTRLNEGWISADFADQQAGQAYVDTWIDIPTLRARIGKTGGQAIADYLLDAMVDGGSTGLRQIIKNFLGQTPDDNQVRGAIWLLFNSPEYAVN